MIYIIVLFGSFFGICAILGVRVLYKNRNVRKFVHSISSRAESARSRGFVSETPIAKPVRNSRASSVALQKVRMLLREAEKHEARKDYSATERVLIQALTVDPDCVPARASLAKLYLTTKREAKAEAIYRGLLSESSVDVSVFANLGLALYNQGNYEDACAAYYQALELDPKNPDRSAAVGRACLAARKYKEAVPFLEKACERLARDTELLTLLAQCYEKLSNSKKAEETYRKLHKLQPYNDEVKEKIAAFAQV